MLRIIFLFFYNMIGEKEEEEEVPPVDTFSEVSDGIKTRSTVSWSPNASPKASRC
jgi:hypothetical protein